VRKKNRRFIAVRNFQIIVYIAITLISCSKGGAIIEEPDAGAHVFNPQDVTAPVITVNTPTDNQVFVSGSTITISGRLTDDYGLYRGTIKVIKDATGFELKNQPYEIHGFKTYDFSLPHVTSETSPADYTIVVSFEDHGLNVTTKSVKVKVNP
jgi:hypothetical protein